MYRCCKQKELKEGEFVLPQPVLGILTLYLNDKKQLEERPIYQKMITAGYRIGIDVFVFTPEDVNSQKHKIHGMFYNPKTHKWTRKWTSFPHLIFDRCRLQNSERFRKLLRFRAKYASLHFLNRPLRNKWTIYQVLRTHPIISNYLPATKLYTSSLEAQQMLKKEGLVFLKPINGTGGRGILRIEKMKDGKFDIQGRDRARRIIPHQRISAAMLGPKLSSLNFKGKYIIQKGIQIKLPNGRVHDYRLLVQKGGTGEWSVTGCAGRVGAINSITSNLHGGGEAYTMEKLLNEWIHDDGLIEIIKQTIEELGIETAKFLEEKYGALCELALDLAIDRKGNVWMLEVNPKPAREVFIRAGEKETYIQAIINPIEYAYWVYKQKMQKTQNNVELPLEHLSEIQNIEMAFRNQKEKVEEED